MDFKHFTPLLIAFILVGCHTVSPDNITLDAPANQIEVGTSPESEELQFGSGDIMQDPNQAVADPYLPTPPSPSSNGDTGQAVPNPSAAQPKQIKELTLRTSKGDIVIELFAQQAPQTVQNFIDKSLAGHYHGLTFHRVDAMVIQGGDPLGNGTGGGKMPAEYNQIPFVEGSVGVARGMDKKINNDSQFFICLNSANCAHLTGEYTNFGRVKSGLDVVRAIKIGDVIDAIAP